MANSRLAQIFEVLRSISSLGPALIYGLAGIAFIVATLVMSLTLDAHDFAEATLLLSISNLAVASAPAGFNGIVLRYDLRTDVRLMRVGVAIVVGGAVVASVVAHKVYSLQPGASAVLFISVLTGGAAFLTLPKLQRAHKFIHSAVVGQSAAFSALFAALLMLAGFGRLPWFPIIVCALGFALVGTLSTKILRQHSPEDVPARFGLWTHAMHFWGIALASELISQLERLLIPLLLDRKALASFAVVAAVAIAPYRIIEMATATTLVARLRTAKSIEERRDAVRREAILLVPVTIGSALMLALVGLPICRYFRPDADDITYAVLAVAATSGFCRVLMSLSRSTASALCTERELAWVNLGGWVGIAAGCLGAWLLSGLGLVGVILGAAAGWILRALITAGVSYKHLVRI